MLTSWGFTEVLKVIVRRPRPFDALANAPGLLPAPETVIAHPSSFSFPSGDASLAMGAAVAFAYVSPKYRVPILLLGVSAALARVVVGVHYPFDVLGGITVGIVAGFLAPRTVALFRRRLRWRAFVIPHTHWDREWYERFEGYRARLVPMVSRLLDLLERDADFRSFTFDGQTIAIQDYLEKRPADVPRVEALVRRDRLLIGPWHVLADLLLVSGESIVRNLQEGLRSAGELGRAARVAYVADPFGHPAQLPQILRAFGYDTYVFARGMGDEGESVGSEFWWVSPSGDRVRAAHLVDHYSNALPLVGPPDEDPAALRRRVKAKTARLLDRLTPYANGDAILLMVGDDHVEAYARLPEAVREMRQVFRNVDARIASLEEFAAAMPPLQHEVSGEIASGRYRPILRGVNSTRVWIKQENVACERLLLEWCEPLDALTGGTGRDELRDLWRMLLQNHPHDSICGCSIDAVHDVDMAPRFAYVREHGEALASRLLERLAGRGTAAMVWNPLPWARDAVVPLDGVPTRVRAGGLGLSPAVAAESDSGVKAAGDAAIENGVLLDVGGGSLEMARFRNRRAVQSWTLPLGSLRVTDRFLGSDPPKSSEINALQEHVTQTLRSSGAAGLRDDESLVGTGGTIRNLAKMHRATVVYPIPRLHGYTLARKGIRDLVAKIVSRPLSRRSTLPGLSSDRADTICGGALVVQAAFEALGASELVVSGQGLREGVAYEEFAHTMPTTAAVRRASLAAIASRFTSWDGERARRRVVVRRHQPVASPGHEVGAAVADRENSIGYAQQSAARVALCAQGHERHSRQAVFQTQRQAVVVQVPARHPQAPGDGQRELVGCAAASGRDLERPI